MPCLSAYHLINQRAVAAKSYQCHRGPLRRCLISCSLTETHSPTSTSMESLPVLSTRLVSCVSDKHISVDNLPPRKPHHEKYYHNGDILEFIVSSSSSSTRSVPYQHILQVEDIYYSVHKYLFVRDSFCWTDCLDNHPRFNTIVLKDVTQTLLSVMYSACVPSTPC